jgi:diguanylate cyclase
MTAHDPSLHRRQGLLGWLGLTSRDIRSDQEPAARPDRDSLRSDARLRQLHEIGSFLAFHDLDLSSQSLSVAFDYLNGTDPRLARLIDRQIQARQPVSRDWLDEVLRDKDQDKDAEQLKALMQRLEASIDEFGKTSREARTATSEYSSALESHVGELEQVTVAGAVISELATIAKVMIGRTREIEKQMLRSEAQTRSLKRKLDEARRSADHDHLTGLPNRRAFEAHFAEEFVAARAAGEALSVAFCDIDHFKRINDTHGHDAGDRVLKVVAENLARISDERCHVARHGGEEFVVLFRDLLARDALLRLDRLRTELAERRLVNRANDVPFGQITFSGGVADVFAFPDRGSALKAADAALYRAKEAGRNRILLAEAPPIEAC